MWPLPPSAKGHSILKDNAIKYAQSSTIHGVPYICDKSLPLVDRLLWALAVGGFLVLACVWTSDAYQDWTDNPVITTLKDTEKEVAGLEFPAVTICREGLNMDTVYRALQLDFKEWQTTDSPRQKRQADVEKGAIADYLEEKLAIRPDSNVNVFDLLSAMVADDVDRVVGANGVMRNLQACRGDFPGDEVHN
jgi:hypothetical protein